LNFFLFLKCKFKEKWQKNQQKFQEWKIGENKTPLPNVAKSNWKYK
jgi:hypothetical protein